ncbi:hypothetical protein G6O67_008881 [Ophiocordyceps sinensis]|uniref:PaxU n=4 Tax=Ophiocordyceps sinensis TaxID=72228 RepID=A0A8H4PIN0_9HYPO|nr:PaxU [Ophiocordyceps sinensis CO18]KAF4503786.1 hypothetical protein G6O67_008881 [Ophiocordyceps sinensis]
MIFNTPKSFALPGFRALSDQVFVRPGSVDQEASASDPDTIIIYGWGDASAKHVVKFADGYRRLFPRAKQVIVLSPMLRLIFSKQRRRLEYMMPVVEAVEYGAGENSTLVHAMSHTGLTYYAATAYAYQRARNRFLPHRLLVLDSAPGYTHVTPSSLIRASRSLTLKMSGKFPGAVAAARIAYFVIGCVTDMFLRIMGWENIGCWSRRAANNEKYEAKEARRLYMYSKEDDIIPWDEIELHLAEARDRGWEAEAELFHGSGHVGHMRQSPEQYWTAVGSAWRRAVEGVDEAKL